MSNSFNVSEGRTRGIGMAAGGTVVLAVAAGAFLLKQRATEAPGASTADRNVPHLSKGISELPVPPPGSGGDCPSSGRSTTS